MAADIFTSTASGAYGRGGANAAVALQPDPTDFEAALAILVADGADPTEQHVTDVNDAYTLLAADQVAYVAAVDALADTSADITLAFNASSVVTMNKLNVAVRNLLALIGGQKILT